MIGEELVMKVINCKKGQQYIYGQAYIPEGEQGKYPTVIISHGYGGSYQEMKEFGEFLVNYGIASYVFDFCGGSNNSRSDGSMLEMSVITEMDDLNVVIDQVRNFDFVDQDNIFLLGESQGGLVTALVGEEREDEVKGLILLYPAFNIPEYSMEPYASLDEVPAVVNILGSNVGKVYFEDILKIDINKAITGYSKNVLIVHGDCDGLVPIENSYQAVKSYHAASLEIIKGAEHGFYDQEVDQAASVILDFIRDNVPKLKRIDD